VLWSFLFISYYALPTSSFGDGSPLPGSVNFFPNGVLKPASSGRDQKPGWEGPVRCFTPTAEMVTMVARELGPSGLREGDTDEVVDAFIFIGSVGFTYAFATS
jgi:hypothetical protein